MNALPVHTSLRILLLIISNRHQSTNEVGFILLVISKMWNHIPRNVFRNDRISMDFPQKSWCLQNTWSTRGVYLEKCSESFQFLWWILYIYNYTYMYIIMLFYLVKHMIWMIRTNFSQNAECRINLIYLMSFLFPESFKQLRFDRMKDYIPILVGG